ncbi:hypothetical protein [Leptotrichia buccalis]|uniref:Uncharacterized protein n=1 Tax=Leptotrichia buccalis (strain ATCC 14201 / DSM 1135 / JCM 12969 / NCTC 10249 / C-1013-b) TaxID=523794 RepID=C7NBR4_LEPBD|nr:hypothetical protein [Leptotrichia buccalis]ACV39595.1 hypothetical protein Lebu_1727 [Leptotrichia buccalis C-1013-b]
MKIILSMTEIICFFFPEKNFIKMFFDKNLIYDFNKDLRESIIILFKKDNIEIFSCDVTLKIPSGIQLSNIGKMRKIIPREKVKVLKLVKKITRYKLYFKLDNESKAFRIDIFFRFNKNWVTKNINYLIENKLI